ncbi:hypothetical protein [Streptomyces sparsus]
MRGTEPSCGAVRPAELQTPPLVASRLPCAEPAGHDAAHRDALGHRWVATAELVQALAVTVTAEQVRQALRAPQSGTRSGTRPAVLPEGGRLLG